MHCAASRILLILAILAAVGLAARPAAAFDRSAAAPADSGAIRGVVVDAESGHPLPGTIVQVVELRRTDVTHADGSFQLLRVPPGRYTVVIERLGYRRETLTVEVDGLDTPVLEVRLETTAIDLPGMMVTGAIGAHTEAESFRPAHVISGQELTRKLDVTIAATVAGEPGMGAVSTGPAAARPVIRGMGGDRILVLEDGGRVGDLSASTPDHAVAIEPVTAKQVEVVRGPAALLFGSNALGGVVNVIREEVPGSLTDAVHGSVSLQAQSMNRGVTGGGTVSGSVGSLAWRAEATGRTGGDMRTPAGMLENTSYDTYSLSAGSAWVGNWGHLGGAYRLYDSEYGLPGGFVGAHEEGVRIRMRRHTVRGELKLRDGIGPFSSLDVDGIYSYYHHRELEADGSLGTEFGQLSAVGGVLARHEGLGPFSHGAIGIQAQWRDFAAGGHSSTPPAVEHGFAVYGLEEFDVEPLRFQVGARYDWRRIEPGEVSTSAGIGEIRARSFGSLSGSVGVLYALTPSLDVGVSAARAFRTPDVTELFSQGPHLAVYSFEVGNPDLEEEIGFGLDVFARYSSEKVQAEFAAFRNAIDAYIYPRNTGELSRTGLPIYQFTGQDALLVGVEGSLQWNLRGGWVVEGSGSYVRGSLRANDQPLPFIPPLNGQLAVKYETPGYFARLGARMAARQDRTGEFEEPTAGFTVLDASAGYRWMAFGRIHSVTARVDNLTNATYREHLSRVKSIMPEAGRSLSVFYRVNF